jgi:hypothetical protein
MNRHNLSLFLAVFLVLLNVAALAQKKDSPLMKENVEWSEGTVVTKDGTELNGLLRYEDNTNILYYQDGTDNHAYTSRNVMAFAFTDAVTGKPRTFYTLTAVELNTDIVRPLFFEFIREFENFTVFSRLDRIAIEKKMDAGGWNSMTGTIGSGGGTHVEISQSETIYFMDKQGVIKPYLQIIDREGPDSWLDLFKARNKVDEALLENLTAPLYHLVKECADKNHLSLKRKSDLLAVLDCYAKS